MFYKIISTKYQQSCCCRKRIDQVATNEKIRAPMKKLSEENAEAMRKINASKAMRKINASKLTVTEQRIALKKQKKQLELKL